MGVVNNYAARFLPAGFYYKTFIHPRPFWKHVFEPIIRRSAGLGKAPKERDADRYEQAYAFCDLLVVGGGIAGLQAARIAGAAGARVMVLEQAPHWGGRAPVDGDIIDGAPAEAWINTTLEALGRWRMSRCGRAAWLSVPTTTATCWPKSGLPTIPPATGGRANAVAHSRGQGPVGARRDRAALVVRGQ